MERAVPCPLWTQASSKDGDWLHHEMRFIQGCWGRLAFRPSHTMPPRLHARSYLMQCEDMFLRPQCQPIPAVLFFPAGIAGVSYGLPDHAKYSNQTSQAGVWIAIQMLLWPWLPHPMLTRQAFLLSPSSVSRYCLTRS